MAPTPNSRKEFLALLNPPRKRKSPSKKKTKCGRGFKKSNFIENIDFIRDLTDPKASTMKRRKCLCQLLTSSKKGAGRFRAVDELISNVHASQANMNLPGRNIILNKLKKHEKDLSKYINCKKKKEKIKILHKHCQKGGFLQLLGPLVLSLAKPFLGALLGGGGGGGGGAAPGGLLGGLLGGA